ncbi:MAG: Trp family transcriptional regulator [bacterium]
MKKSTQSMNNKIEAQVYKILYQVLADAKNEVEVELTLKALMSENELSAIAKRLAIAVFLDKRQSYEHIKDVLKVSTATIASVAENMNNKGLQMALTKVKAEEWADVWSIRLSRALEKLMK